MRTVGIAFVVTVRVAAGFAAFTTGGTTVNADAMEVGPAREIARETPQYDLVVRLLPDARRLEVTGTVRLPATAAPRDTLSFVLSRQMTTLRVDIIEPAVSTGPTVVASTPKDRGLRWSVRPQRPIPAAAAPLVRFSYTGGEEVDRLFYVGPEVSFASAYGTDWYPLIDDPEDKGVGTLQLVALPGEAAIAEGQRLSGREEEARGVFRFENRHPSYFSFAAGRFHLVRRAGQVPIVLYLLRQPGDMGRFLDGVADILAVLTMEFGPYPFPELALVEVPRDLAQKAGFNAATLQGFAYVNHRSFDVQDIAVLYEWLGHEISHTWFPDTVSLRTPPGLYVEEALAEYGGLRVVETLAGPVAAEQFRRTGYAPDPIYSAQAYFQIVGRGGDHELGNLQPSQEHRQLAYTKGFLVWDMLAREVGRENFRRALQRITRKYSFRSIAWRDFLREIERGTRRNLQWFYEEWFACTGAPEFRISWRQRGAVVRGVITQTAPTFRVHIEVAFTGPDRRRVVRRVMAERETTEFSYRLPFLVQSVALDPDYLVLRWTPEFHQAARGTVN